MCHSELITEQCSYIPRLHRSSSTCGNILSVTFKLVDGNLSPPLPSPQPISFPGDVEIAQVSLHPEGKHVLALSQNREVYSWGTGENGQLGLGDIKWVGIRRHSLTLFSPDFQTGLAKSLNGILPLNIADWQMIFEMWFTFWDTIHCPVPRLSPLRVWEWDPSLSSLHKSL